MGSSSHSRMFLKVYSSHRNMQNSCFNKCYFNNSFTFLSLPQAFRIVHVESSLPFPSPPLLYQTAVTRDCIGNLCSGCMYTAYNAVCCSDLVASFHTVWSHVITVYCKSVAEREIFVITEPWGLNIQLLSHTFDSMALLGYCSIFHTFVCTTGFKSIVTYCYWKSVSYVIIMLSLHDIHKINTYL